MTFGSAFLAQPGPHPSLAETPWGDISFALPLAGAWFELRGLSPAQRDLVCQRFCAEGDSPPLGVKPCVTHLFQAPAASFLHPPTAGWELSMDFEYHPEWVRSASLRMTAMLQWPNDGAKMEGKVWSCTEAGEEFLGVVENHLRVLTAYHLLTRDGLLLHSSGVVEGEAAYLFLGRSGAGKTTVARLSQAGGRDVLSDDMNAVVAAGAKPRVLPVPFAGELEPTPRGRALEKLPLAALLRLRKGRRHHLQTLSPSEGMATLTACSPFVNRDPHRQERLLDNVGQLLEHAAVGELEFRQDDGFWEWIGEDR